jgi:hypothetical protein
MRTPAALFALPLVVACGGSDGAPSVGEGMAGDVARATTPTLADFDGSWLLHAHLDGTPDPVTVRLGGSAVGGWMMTFEGRQPMAVEVSMAGDSLIMVVPEYESVIRDGVMVSTRTAVVLRDGRMVGKVVAIYRAPDGEEVVGGTIDGERVM